MSDNTEQTTTESLVPALSDLTAKNPAYFDLQLRMTHEQLDEIVRQELQAQLAEPCGIPESVQSAMETILNWYTPQVPEPTRVDWITDYWEPQEEQITDEDYRRHVQ